MSGILTSVKNGFSGATEVLTNFVNSLEFAASNLLILICLIVLLVTSLYLFIIYVIANKKLNDLTNYALSVRSLGKVYSNAEYDPIIFQKLFFDSLDSLRGNINIITTPYFYSKKIDEILTIYPDYIKVMKFSKYVYDHPDTKNDAVHKILIEKYGKNYRTSPELEIVTTVTITGFRKSTYKHSLLIDISRAQTIYKLNMSRVNILLKNSKT